jgi:hypothetical protein
LPSGISETNISQSERQARGKREEAREVSWSRANVGAAEIEELRSSVFFLKREFPARDLYNEQVKEIWTILTRYGGLENSTEDSMFDVLSRI